MLEEVFTGAVTPGVNLSTFLFLNILLLSGVAALGSLLLLAPPALAPHVGFLLFLGVSLWILLDWYIISVLGFVDPEQQRRQLAEGLQQQQEGAAGADAKKAR